MEGEPAQLDRLPLFPLGTVLFPGLLLPLHVFEERYRALVAHLVRLPEGQPRRFGVVAIREGREVGADGVRALHDVGCVAAVQQVERLPDGRYDLLTTGTSRFRVRRLRDDQPYLSADVEILGEAADARAHLLAPPTGALFRRYRHALLAARGEEPADPPPELPEDPAVLSYLVSAAMVLGLVEKQALLGAPTVAERLALARRLLVREAGLLETLPSLPATDLTAPHSLS